VQAEYDASEERVRALRRELMFMEADNGHLQDQLAEVGVEAVAYAVTVVLRSLRFEV
jgi:hypothetical protein